MEDSPNEIEPSVVLTPDADNATYFDPEDASGSNSINYKRLMLYNRGTWYDRREENKELTHRRDNLAVYDSLSSQLDLTEYQKEEGRRIFDELNFGTIGKPVRLVAFGVCIIVANDDVPNGVRYHPQMNDPDQLFIKIAERLNFTEKDLHSIMGVVKSRLPRSNNE